MALKIDLAMLNKGLGLKTVAQRSGVKALVDAFASDGDDDKRKLAYILATARHETGGKYQPVREIPPKRKLLPIGAMIRRAPASSIMGGACRN
jgi:hypothetical protein